LESANSPWTKKEIVQIGYHGSIVITREKQLSSKKSSRLYRVFQGLRQNPGDDYLLVTFEVRAERRWENWVRAQYYNQVKIVQIYDKRCRLTAKNIHD
jgi:hypothetical protein